MEVLNLVLSLAQISPNFKRGRLGIAHFPQKSFLFIAHGLYPLPLPPLPSLYAGSAYALLVGREGRGGVGEGGEGSELPSLPLPPLLHE